MSTNPADDPKQKPPSVDEATIIHRRIEELDCKIQEQRKEDKDYKDRQLRFNKWLTIATIGLLITSVIGTGIAIYQSETAKTQADDFHAQMEATMPAIVNFFIGMSNHKVAISAENHGRFRAKKVGGKITITRQTLPDYRQIGQAISYDVVLRDLDGFPQGRQQTADNSFTKDFEIPGFTTKDMAAIMRMEQTLTVQATFSYDDGLGEIHESRQCVSFLWSPMMTNINGAGMAYRGFQECQQFAASLKTVEEWRKQQAKPSSPN